MQSAMKSIHRLDHLREEIARFRAEQERIALVPTMGALHEGHLTLVRAARERADRVAVSIFVNPTQFGPNEDLAAYPRTLEADTELLRQEGIDLLWAPNVPEMYPEGFATSISVDGVSADFCGASRPGHFAGVATVVCKLFNQVRPDMAFFGEKDWQQLAVIRRMARDLDLVEPHVDAIHGVPIVRESDGLAMSSRNAYLSHEDRAAAAALPREMREAIRRILAGEPDSQVMADLRNHLIEAGFDTVDYAEMRNGADLTPAIGKTSGDRLFVAARIRGTRLIDNMPIA